MFLTENANNAENSAAELKTQQVPFCHSSP